MMDSISKKDISLLTAKDLMSKAMHTLSSRHTVSEAIILLAKNKISGAPVVDDNNKVIGMFTEADILRYFSVHPNQEINILNVPIIFSENPITVRPDTPVYKIQRILLENGYRAIPVVAENNSLLGIIARRDILKYIFVVNRRNQKY